MNPLMFMASHQMIRSAFDPLVDLTPLYFIHTDDTSVVGGGADQITDRMAGKTWSALGATNRPIIDTAQFSGHDVWKFDDSVTTRKALRLTDATLAGQYNTAPALTMCLYLNNASAPNSANDYFSHTDNITSYGTRVTLGPRTSTSLRFLESAAGVLTTYQSSATYPSGWGLAAVTSDGAGTIKWWFDGVQIGSTVVGVHRSPASMTDIVLGDAVSIGAGTRTYYVGGYAAFLGQLTSQNMIDLSAWFAASFT